MFLRLFIASAFVFCGVASRVGSSQIQAANRHNTVYTQYQCSGIDFNGQHYRGTVSIELKGESYELNWDVTSGSNVRTQYQAIGLRVGNTLSAAWAGNSVAGIIVYEIHSNGTMTGKWTVFGNTSTRQENLSVATSPASHANSRSQAPGHSATPQTSRSARKKVTANDLFHAATE